MAEAGVPDAAMQSIAGHLSKKMLDHYSHVRMAAKRQAVEALGGGLIGLEPDAEHATQRQSELIRVCVRGGLRHKPRHNSHFARLLNSALTSLILIGRGGAI